MNKQLLKFFCLLFIMQILIQVETYAILRNDYGYQGTITIEVGEQKYIPLLDAIQDMLSYSTTYYPSGKWVLSDNSYNVSMISQSMTGCTIRGDKKGTNIKLTFSGDMILYDAMWEYTGYYLIKVVDPVIKVSNISISPSSASLTAGETKQLSATISPSNATDKSVTWSSSNTSVATVSNSGLVTAKAEGNCTITCKANDGGGANAKCKVLVESIPVERINLNETSITFELYNGSKTKQLSAEVLPANASNKSVTWSSNNTDVATVSSNGLVTAKAEGNCTVTCKANDGSGKQATCSITVKKTPTGQFTAKTVEGVEMTFYGYSDGTCYVYGQSSSTPSIDKNTSGKITIPSEINGSKVVEIGSYAFEACTGITEIVVPSSVEKIGFDAFYGCTSLEKVALGNGVKSLGHYVFYGCASLQAITGISQLEEIGSYTFNVTYNTFIPWYNSQPDGLLYLGKVLYKYKGTMPENTSVSVKNGTKQISEGCFENCTGLIYVSIPESVSDIGRNAFDYCPNLSSIEVSSGNTKYDSRNSCNAIIEKETNTMIVGCKNSTFPSTLKAIGSWAFTGTGITEVIIPNNIESLDQSAFAYNKSLTSIVIGKGVKEMGDGSNPFLRNSNVSNIAVASANPYYDSRDNCNAIIETSTGKLITGCSTTVIPSTVKAIGAYAFASDNNNSVYIPDDVEKIERRAFLYSSLHTVLIGKNIKEIEKEAFAECSKLQDVYSFAEDPVEIDESAFSNLYGDKDATYNRATLHVPVGSKTRYQNATGWKKFHNIVEGEPEPDPEPITKGDVNGDGVVNGTDLVALTNMILGKTNKTDAADVNGDGQVNGTDYVALVNIVLGRTNGSRTGNRAGDATAKLSIEPFDIKAGEEKEMVIDLTNPQDEITLVQFDLKLPSGLSIKKVGGEYDFDIADRTTWRKHSLDANDVEGGATRFLLASSSNATLSGTEGAIIKITLKADNTFSSGDIKLENILLVSPSEKETKQPTYTYHVGESQPSTSEASLAAEAFSIKAGEEKELVIDLLNPKDEITLVQFDLRLPSGLTLKQINGEYDIDIAGRTTWRKHSLDANATDGIIRFLLSSSSNATLSGTEGAIIKMTLKADNSFASGTIKLENILLVTPDEKEIKPASLEINTDGTGIHAVVMKESDNAIIYSISGQRLAAPKKGINIINGRKVIVK